METIEEAILAPYAAFSRNSKGRERTEAESPIRTAFQRDRDRIIHANSFRRLKGKTQVFMAPAGDHYATRLSHVLEVSQVARVISRALALNEDLTEAIALAHDLGHAPFGHPGQEALDRLLGGGYRHDEQSLRVVRLLEREGRGLNLTFEVLDGIRTHRKPRHTLVGTTAGPSSTSEAEVVRLSDAIAYINHDVDDAVRGGIITPNDLPSSTARTLGETRSQRIDTVVRDIVGLSYGQPSVSLNVPILKALDELRDFLYDRVYTSPIVKSESERARTLVTSLFRFLCEHPSEMPDEYQRDDRNEGVERCVADYIAGMTDSFAIQLYQDLFIPKVWAPGELQARLATPVPTAT